MKLGRKTKQPNERRSYTVDYTQDLTEGDSLLTVSFSVFPANELVIDQHIILGGKKLKFWAADGEDLVTYKVTISLTTEDGEKIEDEIMFKVKDE